MRREITFFVPSNRRGKNGRPLGFPGLNEMVREARTNRFASAKQKDGTTEYVRAYAIKAMLCQPWEMPKCRCLVTLTFVEPHRLRDPDNVFAGAKFVLDAITERGGCPRPLIEDDSQRCMDLRCALADHTDKERPGVWVRIQELEE